MNITTLLSTAALAAWTVQADWPGYRGPSHDGHAPESIATQWPSSGPKVLWRVPSPGGFSSFVVGGGRACTIVLRDIEGTSMECLVALDAGTGRELWAKPLNPVKFDGSGNADRKSTRLNSSH